MPNSQCLLTGTPEPEPLRVPLRAGPFSLIFENGDLRSIHLGEREVLRRIYAAVRDRNWRTIPSIISNLKFDRSDESFVIRYDAEHKQDDIDFVWRAEITGEANGHIRFNFEGEARATFLKNRIGFCVLHPIRECAGMPCRVEYTDGRSATTTFPRRVVAEQPVRDLHDLRALAHEVMPGRWAEVRFEGDAFELEDQRNWIDASFKTFGTPLRIPFPVEVKAGTRIRQSVELSLLQSPNSQFSILNSQSTDAPRREINLNQVKSTTTVEVIIGTAPPCPLPKIGLGASTEKDLRAHPKLMHKRLKALALSHVRVDLRLSTHDWIAKLFHTLEWAERLKLGLEIALHVTQSVKRELENFITYPPLASAKIARFIVFHKDAKVTPTDLLERVRRKLGAFRPGIPIGAGTNADFYELNQVRPRAEFWDFVCWSMNPQVHASDNASLVETPEAIADQIETARECFPGKPLAVSPITLRPRFNAVATGPEPPTPPGELPSQVDPRQMSLLGAGWTLAILKHCVQARVDSVTLYEAAGWRGVMELDGSTRLPEKFHSIPGSVFPLYHVLADLGEFAAGEAL
ncbi:MAG: hypothetical protein L0Z50_24160, partial [Verrucomicrobiales bacterium]|nr:hypothetical protein [Verrucomicrobiales bacterium]